MKRILEYIEKYQLLYWLLFAILISVTIIRFYTINIGFCTAWDEAYFLIKLRIDVNARIILIFTSMALSERSTLLSIATPFSVKA